MLLGCIADDFTGASDLANTLAKGGMRTKQFSGLPQMDHAGECEAGVISLKTRSIPAVEAVSQSLVALEWLRLQGCRQFFFKHCSTFDSTRDGNIGPVAEALLEALGAPSAIVCPAFPATGRSLYMGHLFVGDRLLNESGMENHPLNPMTDPDIRRWLRQQTRFEVGHVPLDLVEQGAEVLDRAIEERGRAGHRLIVVDAVSDRHLMAIGRAVSANLLVTGGSGVALGLPTNLRDQGLLAGSYEPFIPLNGPGVVLSGSCSKASLAQVDAYRKRHPGISIDAGKVISGEITVAEVSEFVWRNVDDAPIVYSTAAPDAVAASQSQFGRVRVASAIEEFFGALASALVARGLRRLVVGGGETSGAVVTALQPDELFVGPEIDPGVPALAVDGDRPLRLALKSGNFGSTDFFEKALKALGAP